MPAVFLLDILIRCRLDLVRVPLKLIVHFKRCTARLFDPGLDRANSKAHQNSSLQRMRMAEQMSVRVEHDYSFEIRSWIGKYTLLTNTFHEDETIVARMPLGIWSHKTDHALDPNLERDRGYSLAQQDRHSHISETARVPKAAHFSIS